MDEQSGNLIWLMLEMDAGRPTFHGGGGGKRVTICESRDG